MGQVVRPTADHATGRLTFRRQFILGPADVHAFPDWTRLSIRDRHHLAVHPDLTALQVRDGGRSLSLLGYILDPNLPTDGDREIIRRLLGRFTQQGWAGLVEATADLGGRWILIADDGSRVRLLNDPSGYRQVVFTERRHGPGVWCASQPGILADLIGVEPDPEALDFVQRFPEIVSRWPGSQHWWPGDTTGYRGVRHLLPNHYLDLGDGGVHRFWPQHDLVPVPLNEAVERGAHLLRGMIESAARRMDLAMALTAGRDSRLLLAASRAFAEAIQYVTFQYWEMADEDPDLVVPRRLAARLGLNHRVIRCPERMEPWFAAYYSRNVPASHDVYGAIAQALWHEYPPDRLFIKGNASSVLHNFDSIRDRHPHGQPMSLETLQRFSKVSDHPFAGAATARWWERAAGNLYNVDAVQLFYWETKEGKWMATAQLEWDIVQEVLVPYNCRTFMSNALAVHPRFRAGPTHDLQRKLTAALWPDVLREPINALTFHGGPLRRTVRDYLVRHGWHRGVRKVRDGLLRRSGGGTTRRGAIQPTQEESP